MPLKKTTRSRLTVLLVVAFFGATGILGFYKYRSHQLHLKCLVWKQEGLAAESHGDPAKAIDLLRQYLHYHPDDASALVAFIAARLRVPAPNHQEISETISALRYFLSVDPKQNDARRQLMSLYVQVGHDTEAKEAAEQLLEHLNGKDPVALRVLALTNARMKNWAKSQEALDRLLKQVPTDLAAQMQRLSAMRELGKPRPEIVRLAEQLRVDPENKLPDGSVDPRFEVLKAFSLEVAELPSDPNPTEPGKKLDTRSAADWLRLAADRPAPDAQFSTILVDQFNRFGMYDEAMTVLRRAADSGDQPEAQATLHRRLWELRQWPELIARSEKRAGSTVQLDAEFLAMRAFALRAVGKVPEAKSIVSKLASRATDPVSIAWGLVLNQEANPTPHDSKSLQAALRQVTHRDGYLDYFMGETYAAMGESELAIRTWEQAAASAPIWSLPLERLANVLLDRGRLDAARAAAQACAFRSKDANGNVGGSAAMTLIRVEAASLEGPSPSDRSGISPGKNVAERKLLERVDEIQKKVPGEPFTLPIQVGILARISQSEKGAPAQAARDRAIAIVRAALAEDQQPAEDTLLRLAAISRGYQLGLDETCLNRCEKLHGMGPNLAMVRAGALFLQSKPTEAVESIRAARARKTSGDNLSWDLALAKALETARDPDAKKQWRILAEAHPDALTIQEAVLNAKSTAADRELIDQTIERVKVLTGGDGLTWRIARARWLLEEPALQRPQIEQAAAFLNEVLKSSPDYVEAHFILARCLEGLGDIDGAIDHLKLAATRGASSNAAALHLIRLVQSRGDFDKARELLEDLARRELANPQQRRQAASLFAQAGKTQQAMAMLDRAGNPAQETPDLLKASLYDQQNRYAEAKAACETLLKKPDAAIVQFAASFYASHGEKSLADQALKQMDSLSLPVGLKESILAQHTARFGDSTEALRWFIAATKAAPSNPTTWQGLIAWQFRLGQGRDALAAADEGLRALPEDRMLLAVKQNAVTLLKADEIPELRSLTAAMVESAAQRSGVGEALETILKSRGGDAAQNVRVVRGVADKFPMLLPLQLYSIELSRQEGRLDVGGAIAERLAYNFPSNPDGPRLAAVMLLGNGQSLEAIRMADLWRERSLRDAPAADVLIAQARWQLHQLPEAVKQVEPHALAASQFPDSEIHAQALAMYAGGLTLLNQSDKAYSILNPLLTKDRGWRERWIHFATSQFDAANAKQAIERVAALTDANAEAEQIIVTEAWMMLSQRSGGKYLPMARRQIEPLLKRPDATARAFTAMAYVEEMENNSAGAEVHYRKALALDPTFYAANNNLAMLLVRKAGDSGTEGNVAREAVDLAKAAVKAVPSAATYDTLARAQARAREMDGALDSMRTCVKMDANNLTRRLDLIAMLLDFSKMDEARVAITLLESTTASGTNNEIRHRLTELRSRLEGSTTTATRPSATR